VLLVDQAAVVKKLDHAERMHGTHLWKRMKQAVHHPFLLEWEVNPEFVGTYVPWLGG